MKIFFNVTFIALLLIGLFSCSKSNDAIPLEHYTGTYFVKRHTEFFDPSTGNHGFAKDSFLLTVSRSSTGPEINFFSQEIWTVIFNKNNFVINSYIAKRAYFGPFTLVTGSGSFNGDSISYTENMNLGSVEVLFGKSEITGVKQ